MKTTKRCIVAAIALIAALMPAFAQAPGAPGAGDVAGEAYGLAEARRDIRALDLKQEEALFIRELLARDSRVMELARAEIREAQARLARLMLERKPDTQEIGKTVRASLEAEYRVRMAQIERNLAIREKLGDERWAALSRLARGFAVLARRGELKDLAEKAGDAERLAPLLELLKSLQ